jgi:hypothetical protein
MSRPELKKLVAAVVQDTLEEHAWRRVRRVADVVDVTVSKPSSLITQVRVVTEHSGVHYYEIRVKENI